MQIFKKLVFSTLLITCFCSADADTQIIGGNAAEKDAYPWMVGLAYKDLNIYQGQFCGAMLIHPQWVLTAAHCMAGEDTSFVDVFLNGWVLTQPDSTLIRVGIDTIIMHPLYNDSLFINDICLLKLKEPIIHPVISLPQPEDTLISAHGRACKTLGWGVVDTIGFNFADTLQEVDVRFVTNSICDNALSYDGKIFPEMLCAGVDTGGEDACGGDSGGPLIADEDGTWVLAGITSWGNGCGDPDYPGVYARVSKYIDWIKNYIDITTVGRQHVNMQKANLSYNSIDGEINYLILDIISTPKFNLTIFNLHGQVVYSQSLNNIKGKVNISNLPNGFKLATITSAEGILNTIKIVN